MKLEAHPPVLSRARKASDLQLIPEHRSLTSRHP
jgi:hypothetical protein